MFPVAARTIIRWTLSSLALFVLLVLAAGVHAVEPMVITYRSPESPSDKRYDYDNAVLRLALEKTREEWGDYALIPSPIMNYTRAILMLETGELENPMFKLSANNVYCSIYEYAPFPIDLGIVGYRMFFVSREIDVSLKGVASLDTLRLFSTGQGYGWLDNDILEASGFEVIEVPTYESLFHMVASKRFDLLSRGVNEVKNEYEAFGKMADFVLNRDVGLYYPLPRFFFTDKEGSRAAARVTEGLKKAYADGSLQELWEKEYRQSLEFSGFEKVHFIQIPNPFIDKVDDEYKQYFFKVQRP